MGAAMRGACTAAIVVSLFGLGGCVGPPALRQSVLGYDETVGLLDQEILLLNVARLSDDRPPHFTVTSSIAATFNFETGGSIGGSVFEGAGTDVLSLSLESRASENPTFSILPMSGKEFTERVLQPFNENVFAFFGFQGVRIEVLSRLMADGIEMLDADNQVVAFYFNKITERAQFHMFRQIVLHLGALQDAGRLHVSVLTYEQVILDRVKSQPSTDDITKALENNLSWRQNADGTFTLTRQVRGRVVITDRDIRRLSNAERQELNEVASAYPENFVFVDVRDGQIPGRSGEMGVPFQIRGAFKLRSLFAILDFVGKSIEKFPEERVTPDPRSGPIDERRNPVNTLDIRVTDDRPTDSDRAIEYLGRFYSVGTTRWDKLAFTILYELFQVTVTEVNQIGIPVTIAK